MTPLLYRCPNAGKMVQGWVADDPAENDDNAYEAVTCLACSRVHLVNPRSGRVLGDQDE